VRAFHFLFLPAYLVCSVLAPVVFVWAGWRWWKTKPKFEEPLWRAYWGLAAFGLGGLSLLVWMISIVWALAVAGFPYFDPGLLQFYRTGLYLGLAGVFASIPGQGKLRWPACVISFIMAVLWVLTASRQ